MFDVAIKSCNNLTRSSLDNFAHDRSMAHFHCNGAHDLFGVSKARRMASSLQRVVEGQFSLREHYDGRRHC